MGRGPHGASRLDALKQAFLENAARNSDPSTARSDVSALLENLAAAAAGGRREAARRPIDKNKPR